MKILKNFYPTKQGIIIAAAVGIATKNIIVGISIILLFCIITKIRLNKK